MELVVSMALLQPGGLLCDAEGRWKHGFQRKGGADCSPGAELWALRDGLKLAEDEHIFDFEVKLDSSVY